MRMVIRNGLSADCKKGNSLTYQETEGLFTNAAEEKKEWSVHLEKAVVYEKQLATYEVYKTSEKNWSRMEYRTMQICYDTELVTLCRKQTEIKAVGWLEQVRIPMEKEEEGNDTTLVMKNS